MKCPSCGFICSELRDLCPRCVVDLRPFKREHNLTISFPSLTYEQLLVQSGKEPKAPGLPTQPNRKGMFGWLFGINDAPPAPETTAPIEVKNEPISSLHFHPSDEPVLQVPSEEVSLELEEPVISFIEEGREPSEIVVKEDEEKGSMLFEEAEAFNPSLLSHQSLQSEPLNSPTLSLAQDEVEFFFEPEESSVPPLQGFSKPITNKNTSAPEPKPEKKEEYSEDLTLSPSPIPPVLEFSDEDDIDSILSQLSVEEATGVKSSPTEITPPEEPFFADFEEETAIIESEYEFDFTPSLDAGKSLSPGALATVVKPRDEEHPKSPDATEPIETEPLKAPLPSLQSNTSTDTPSLQNEPSLKELLLKKKLAAQGPSAILQLQVAHEEVKKETTILVPEQLSSEVSSIKDDIESLYQHARKEIASIQERQLEVEITPAWEALAVNPEEVAIFFDLAEKSLVAPGEVPEFQNDIEISEKRHLEAPELMQMLQKVEARVEATAVSLKNAPLLSSTTSLEGEEDSVQPKILSPGFFRRLCSLLIDGTAIILLSGMGGVLLGLMLSPELQRAFATETPPQLGELLFLGGLILGLLPVIESLYLLFCYTLFRRSLGQGICGIHLVSIIGTPLKVSRAYLALRAFHAPLSTLFLGPLFFLFGKRSLSDRFTYTRSARLQYPSAE